VREVFYTGSGEKLYDLRDDPHYITISDRANPEGCDVHFFSPCGNAYLSVISTPFKASFSNSGVTFTVLYRPRSLYYPNIYGTLRVYRTSDGKLLKIIGSLAHPVQDFSYAPNAEELLIGFVDGSIMLWDIHADEINYSSWHFHEEGAFLSFSADGDFLVIQRRHVVEIRSSDDGTMRSRIPASAVSLSPDGRMMAVGTEEGLIRILDIASGSTLLNIDAHDDIVYSIAFSPDGLYLASSGQDCKLRTWSVVSGEYLHPLETISVNPDDIWGLGSRILIHYLRFVPDTNGIIGFGSWGTVVNWNVDSGAKKYIVESAPLEYYQGMMTVKPYFPEFFSLDLVEQRFQINRLSYNLQDGAYIGEYEPPENLPEYCGYPGPRSLTGNLIFTKGYEYLEGQICIMDSASYQLLGKIEVVQKEDTYFDSIDWLYLSPNGDQLYVSTYGGMVHVYQIALMEQ
jgi:WD40 repeat protein